MSHINQNKSTENRWKINKWNVSCLCKSRSFRKWHTKTNMGRYTKNTLNLCKYYRKLNIICNGWNVSFISIFLQYFHNFPYNTKNTHTFSPHFSHKFMKFTFSISDSVNVCFIPILFRYSGDKKLLVSILTGTLILVGSIWLATGTTLNTTRPRDVIWRLSGFTNGNIRDIDGVSENRTIEKLLNWQRENGQTIW